MPHSYYMHCTYNNATHTARTLHCINSHYTHRYRLLAAASLLHAELTSRRHTTLAYSCRLQTMHVYFTTSVQNMFMCKLRVFAVCILQTCSLYCIVTCMWHACVRHASVNCKYMHVRGMYEAVCEMHVCMVQRWASQIFFGVSLSLIR